jgi:predicted nucleotide-binding protein (sugar kinase/HSP70/actin superfamily)
MGEKPSLTLEVDSHTADAGINTRIDAFIDIVERFRSLTRARQVPSKEFIPAKLQLKGKSAVFLSSNGNRYSIYDPSVHLLLPSMGSLTSELMAAVFSGAGIRATAIPVYDQHTLKTGRANTSCKECLPLILTTGGLLNHLQSRNPDEKILFFMPTCWGNCRFTQYRVFLNRMISRRKIPDVALLSLSNENGYAGLRLSDSMNLLKSIVISDCMDDIRNALRVLAIDLPSAQKTFQEQWERIIQVFLTRKYKDLYNVLRSVADNLSKIPLRYPLSQARTVSLMGEIFVRRDDFSSKELIEKLSAADIVVKRAPILEWISYCDFNVKNGIYEARFDLKKFLEFRIRNMVQDKYEKRIKSIFARSGLYSYEKMDLDTAIAYGENFFDVRFTGESILVAGNFFKDILHTIHGAVSIGPFSCMPTRITEAVMAPVANNETRSRLTGDFSVKNVSTLPFLSVEIDGSPLSQTLEARIEAFCLQVERIYHKMRKTGGYSVAS